MSWVWAVAVGWVLAAVGLALLIGGGIRVADRRARAERAAARALIADPPPEVPLPDPRTASDPIPPGPAVVRDCVSPQERVPGRRGARRR